MNYLSSLKNKTKMTHWKRAFKSDYLSSSDIEGQDLQLTIKNVNYQECVTQSGKVFCNVAVFTDTKFDNKGKCNGGTKPMILNVTNSKIVKKFSGNKTQLEEWNNIAITVYVDHNVRFGSDTVEGLRIRPIQAAKKVETKQLLKIADSKVKEVVDWLIASNKKIDDLKGTYIIDDDIRTKLNNEIDARS